MQWISDGPLAVSMFVLYLILASIPLDIVLGKARESFKPLSDSHGNCIELFSDGSISGLYFRQFKTIVKRYPTFTFQTCY